MDPFRGVGLPEPSAKADIVLCSHSHSDHNNPDVVRKPGAQVLVNFTGLMTIGDTNVKGIGSFHDDADGSKRGRNSIYVFDLDGVRFCHLGDLGHDLSSQYLEAVGEIDVLFVPIGGTYTIGPPLAAKVAEKLKPKIIIPMHYRIQGMHPMFNVLRTIDDFMLVVPLFVRKPNVKKVEGSVFNITKDDFPSETTIVIPSLNL